MTDIVLQYIGDVRVTHFLDRTTIKQWHTHNGGTDHLFKMFATVLARESVNAYLPAKIDAKYVSSAGQETDALKAPVPLSATPYVVQMDSSGNVADTGAWTTVFQAVINVTDLTSAAGSDVANVKLELIAEDGEPLATADFGSGILTEVGAGVSALIEWRMRVVQVKAESTTGGNG